MHKYVYLVITGLWCLIACNTSTAPEEEDEGATAADFISNPVSPQGVDTTAQAARLHFDDTIYNFGIITEGETVTHRFSFRNTGEKHLVITHVRASCGCTVADFPKAPVLPGEGGNIEVRFDSEGRPGQQRKAVTVIANTYPGKTKLFIQGQVNPTS